MSAEIVCRRAPGGRDGTRDFSLLSLARDAADGAGSTLGVGDDIAEDLAQLLLIELVRSQESLRRLGVAENGRQRLIELMNQRAGTLVNARAFAFEQLEVAPATSPLSDERNDQHQLSNRCNRR